MLDARISRTGTALLAPMLLAAATAALPAAGAVITERQLGSPANGVAAGPNGVVYVIHDKAVSYFETYGAGSYVVNGAGGLGKAVSTLPFLWIGDSAGNQIFRVSQMDGQ